MWVEEGRDDGGGIFGDERGWWGGSSGGWVDKGVLKAMVAELEKKVRHGDEYDGGGKVGDGSKAVVDMMVVVFELTVAVEVVVTVRW